MIFEDRTVILIPNLHFCSEIDHKLKAKVLGQEGIEEDVKAELESTFYWLVRKSKGLIQGVSASFDGSVSETWAFQLPPNQKMVVVETQVS